MNAFEQRFDTELGPHARRWAYVHWLPHPELIRSLWLSGVPSIEAGLFPLMLPLVRRLVGVAYKTTPDGGRRSFERARGVFRQVDEHLRDGRRFLVGERFTAANLTFAAPAAPMLLPAECRAVHPALDAVPAAMREDVLRLRDTEAGRFALRLFAQERG